MQVDTQQKSKSYKLPQNTPKEKIGISNETREKVKSIETIEEELNQLRKENAQLKKDNAELSTKLKEANKKADKYMEKAFYDELTSAYTMHYFSDFLEKKISTIDNNRLALEHRRQNGENEVFNLLAIDIDHFKSINDTYGHNKGDEILKKLVSLLKNHIRDEDLVVRTGGEEFIVFLETNPQQAEHIANELRKTVEEQINKAGKLGKSGTISIGIASYSHNDKQMTSDQLKKRADLALYNSKNNGRNLVTVYNEGHHMQTITALKTPLAN